MKSLSREQTNGTGQIASLFVHWRGVPTKDERRRPMFGPLFFVLYADQA
jgi:hypothetical protein